MKLNDNAGPLKRGRGRPKKVAVATAPALATPLLLAVQEGPSDRGNREGGPNDGGVSGAGVSGVHHLDCTPTGLRLPKKRRLDQASIPAPSLPLEIGALCRGNKERDVDADLQDYGVNGVSFLGRSIPLQASAGRSSPLQQNDFYEVFNALDSSEKLMLREMYDKFVTVKPGIDVDFKVFAKKLMDAFDLEMSYLNPVVGSSSSTPTFLRFLERLKDAELDDIILPVSANESREKDVQSIVDQEVVRTIDNVLLRETFESIFGGPDNVNDQDFAVWLRERDVQFIDEQEVVSRMDKVMLRETFDGLFGASDNVNDKHFDVWFKNIVDAYQNEFIAGDVGARGHISVLQFVDQLNEENLLESMIEMHNLHVDNDVQNDVIENDIWIDESVAENLSPDVQLKKKRGRPAGRRSKNAVLSPYNAADKLRKQNRKSKENVRKRMSDVEKNVQRENDARQHQNRRSNDDIRQMELQRDNDGRNVRRQNQREQVATENLFAARTVVDDERDVPYYDVGNMTERCKHCYALYFKAEHVQGSKKGEFNKCCKKGKMKLDWPFERFPDKLYNLLTRTNDALSKIFHERIRCYNAAFAFGSTVALKQDHNAMPFCFRMQGQFYSAINLAAHPDGNKSGRPEYGQLFFLDADSANAERMKHPANQGCSARVMQEIGEALYGVNPYMEGFRMMKDVERQTVADAERDGKVPPKLKLLFDLDVKDKNRYNIPQANEVAAVVVLGDNDEMPPFQGIAVHQKGRAPRTLTKYDKRRESMCYPLFFPSGLGGCYVKYLGDDKYEHMKDSNGNNITFVEYYRYLLSVRKPKAFNPKPDGLLCGDVLTDAAQELKDEGFGNYFWEDEPEDISDFNPLRLAGRLFQQYLVDAYVKVEADKLDFIIKNQKKLKAENYKVLHDYIQMTADKNGQDVGKMIILPSSFKQGPRGCQQGYQDSMSMVRRFGKPSLFVTFTCNPNWDEIKRNLLPGNSALDEPDLVCRVFHLKLKEMMHDIKKKDVFGKVIAYTYVVEFQKRGLPHAHILLILDSDSKIRTPEDVDKIVSAEIPDAETMPRLHEIVTDRMMHGPCGELNYKCVCMVEDKKDPNKKRCSKKFPKAFRDETSMGVDSFAEYKRRDNGVYVEKNGFQMDNRWVVPYNAYLCLKFNAHINVEICASVKAVKYLYKYVYKGHDCARMVASVDGDAKLEHDEVTSYLNMRYITPHESFWRMFEYELEQKSHAVERLDLHLPDEQIIYYTPDADVAEKLNRASVGDTTLTAWFELNKRYPDAKEMYYYEIPEKFTFKTVGDRKMWEKKGLITKGRGPGDVEKFKKGCKPCLGRMYTVHPKQEELFCLRLLLIHVKGAESWQDLLTYRDDQTLQDVVYTTFKEVAVARGLFDTNETWDVFFAEAVSEKSGRKLRELFVALIHHGENMNVKYLWDKFKADLYEDFMHRYSLDEMSAENRALADIEKMLQVVGISLKDFKIDLPDDIDALMETTVEWNKDDEMANYNEKKKTLNSEQMSVVVSFNEKLEMQENGTLENGCMMVDGPGGSGKTYTIETLCHEMRGLDVPFLTSCWMGIAASLLPDGRTMHKNFSLPFEMDSLSSCNAKPNNKAGRDLIKARVLIIDEISMVPRYAIEAIDRKLKELMKNDLPFGGKIMVFSGDFRQILPVMRNASRGDLVRLSVRSSYLWMFFDVYHLKENKRAALVTSLDDNPVNQIDFADWLLDLGDGKIEADAEDFIEIPDRLIAELGLIDEIFGAFIGVQDYHSIAKRLILTTTNDKVMEYNKEMLARLSSDHLATYFSNDKVDSDEPVNYIQYPDEFLHSCNDSGLPPHELQLKIDSPVILLRNLNPAIGLCNGTRMLVKRMHRNLLECEILFGVKAGERVYIPRITLTSSKGKFPFTLYRKQFPIKLCYAMTITKSQGQTIEYAGLDLVDPVFTHGMTYVGCTRVRGWDRLKVAVDPVKKNKIKNIVWKEMLFADKDPVVQDIEMEDVSADIV